MEWASKSRIRAFISTTITDPRVNVIVSTGGVSRYTDTFGYDFPVLLMTHAHLMIGLPMLLPLENSCELLIRIQCFMIHYYGLDGRLLPRKSGNNRSR